MTRKILNPYKSGDKLDKDMVYSSPLTEEIISNLVSQENTNYILLGIFKSGKSSLMNLIQDKISVFPYIASGYLDCSHVNSPEDKQGEITYYTNLFFGETITLLQSLGIDDAGERYSAPRDISELKTFLDLVDTELASRNERAVFFIDELQNLAYGDKAKPGKDSILYNFKDAFLGKTNIVFVCSANAFAERDIRKSLNGLEAYFTPAYLGNLSFDQAKQVIRNPRIDGSDDVSKYIEITDDAIALIYQVTHGNPYEVQLLAENVLARVDYTEELTIDTDKGIQYTIGIEDVLETLEDDFYMAPFDFYFNRKISENTKSDNSYTNVLRVLYSPADSDEVFERLKTHRLEKHLDKEKVQQRYKDSLETLQKTGVVKYDGQKYEIGSALFFNYIADRSRLGRKNSLFPVAVSKIDYSNLLE